MKLFALLAVLAVSKVATADLTVDAKVYSDLAAKGTATVILHFHGPEHSDTLAAFHEEHRPFERAVHPNVLPSILKGIANKHQAKTIEFLKGRELSRSSGSDYTQIWMLNQIIVHNADLGLIQEFKSIKEISRVEAEEIVAHFDGAISPVNGPVNYTLPVPVPTLPSGGSFNGPISNTLPIPIPTLPSGSRFNDPISYTLPIPIPTLPSGRSFNDPINFTFPIPLPGNGAFEDPSINQAQPQWGVENVGAPKLWARGITGKGVVVGVIDTGLRASHEILSANYRSTYGWLDAVGGKTTPYDDDGHGTHCAGTVLGKKGYGVAPDASLIACKGLGVKGGTNADLLRCGQFMVCPTDSRGRNEDCTKLPKIVSNSWGSDSYDTFFRKTVDTMVAQGQIVIFANGNEGSRCGTTGYPADYDKVISVGNINRRNQVAPSSSRGPAEKRTKPDIAAPGSDISSASHKSDTGYISLTGTSMAAPHVAGVAALFAQANSTLNQYDVYRLLAHSAEPTRKVTQTCGGILDSDYPNNQVGYGRVYAPNVFSE